MLSPLLYLQRTGIRHAPAPLIPARLIDRLDTHLRDYPITTVARTRDGAVYPVTTSDIIQRYLYLFGVWEPHLTAWLHRRLQPGDTFIDVGANIGYYTLLAAHLTGPTGHVTAIEPSPDFGRILTRTARIAHRTVRLITAAASDTTGQVTLYTPTPTNLGNTTIIASNNPAPSFTAAAAPLTALLNPDEIATARVIKIDAEGAEAAVIRGLLPALDQLPTNVELVIEITPRALAQLGHSPEAITTPLCEAGFHAYRLTNDYTAHSYPAAQQRPAIPSGTRDRSPP